MIVLYPIKPRYIESILDGDKKFELRRKLPKTTPKYVVLYSTSPVAKVVGYAEVKKVHSLPLEEMWNLVSVDAAIEHDDYLDYFTGIEVANALEFEKVYKFTNPFSLHNLFSDFNIPQSFSYIEPHQFRRITRRKALVV